MSEDDNNRHETLHHYKTKLEAMSPEERLQVGAEAMFHLHCMVGSRNSFTRTVEDGEVIIGRTKAVEDMHRDAYQFFAKYR